MSRGYRYRAARADGSLVRGRVEAVTESQATALLLERGLEPIEVEDASADMLPARPAARRDLAVAFRSLAALVSAGVPLEPALASTERLVRGSLRECLAQARAGLRDGKSLAESLDSARGTVPPLVLGMLRAGERAGRLPGTLEQVATQLELEAELVSRVRHALAYPALLLAAGLASVLVIGTVVVPKFAGLLGEAGQDLPPATRVLLGASAMVTSHWLALVVTAVALAGLVAAGLRRPEGRLRWHRLLLATPALGGIRHGLATSRAARALSGGLEAGMPLLAAMQVAQDAAGDREIALRLARAREQVAGGATLTGSLEHERAFTPSAVQLLAVGEGSGQLAAMAGRAADLAARETERALGTLVALLEPGLVILLGGFVAFVAAALLQAVYSLRPGGI